jgi:outer membrane protein assembly factor BamB
MNMRHNIRIVTLLLSCLAVPATWALGALADHGPSSAADEVAMFRGDPRHSGVYNTAAVHRVQAVAWSFETGGPVRSSPAVTSTTVFVGSGDGSVYAIDRQSGQARWAFETAGPVHGSPAVAGGVVYVTSMDRHLYALDAITGEEMWRFAFGDDAPFSWAWEYYASSPIVVEGVVYVGSGDGHLYAFDAHAGEPKWRFETAGRVRASPAMTDGTVYVGSRDGHLYAVDAETGGEVWKYTTEGVHRLPECRVDCRSIQASPAVADGSVVFCSHDNHVYSLNATDGRENWRFDHEGSWVISSPAISDGLVFTGSSDGHFVQALELATGEERWRYVTPHRVFSSPAIADGVVYFGCHNGFLFALDSSTGEEKWRFRTGGMIQSSPVVADGVVYVGSDDGRLYALTGTTTAEPDRPRLRKVVFWQEYRGWKWFRGDEEVLDYFMGEGYTVLDGPALAKFMDERIGDHAPSVVVFAVDRVPEEIAADPSDETLFRRYLHSGGTVVWMGMPPLAAVIDPQTGERKGLDLARTTALLGVRHEVPAPGRNDSLGVWPTAAGRRWGLKEWWVGTGWVDPDEVSTALASNETGNAVAWVKSYGGIKGSGFVKLWGGREIPFALAAVKAVAEFRGENDRD